MLERVPVTSKDWVPMITITSVLELALTVSPTVMPTETIVPLMGLVRLASASDCSASVSCASALSMSAWSEAICSGVSVEADVPPPVVPPVPLPVPPDRRRQCSPCPRRCSTWRDGPGALGAAAAAGVTGCRPPLPPHRRNRPRSPTYWRCPRRTDSRPATGPPRPWRRPPGRRTPLAGPWRPAARAASQPGSASWSYWWSSWSSWECPRSHTPSAPGPGRRPLVADRQRSWPRPWSAWSGPG